MLPRAYVTALASFCVKGVFAFVITYLLANSLSARDYALWATLFSLGTMLGVAELGVGQLILTTLHEKKGRDIADEQLISDSVVAMFILSAFVLLVSSVLMSWMHILDDIRWRVLLLGTIAIRLIVVPHGAYLSALERYHERKLAEALSLLASALFVLWGVRARVDVSTLLLGVNILITLGSFSIAVRATHLGMPRVSFRALAALDLRRVFSESYPYFLSNISSLATYGGFIALSALILDSLSVARLSLLHNLLLMHAYQIFELIFRLVQPRMKDASMMRHLKILLGLSFTLSLAASGLVGVWMFSHVFNKYEYTKGELMAYTAFVFLEIYYLMLTSEMQMSSALKKKLQWISILKAASFGALLVCASAFRNPSLFMYSTFLVAYSGSMGYIVRQVNRNAARATAGKVAGGATAG